MHLFGKPRKPRTQAAEARSLLRVGRLMGRLFHFEHGAELCQHLALARFVGKELETEGLKPKTIEALLHYAERRPLLCNQKVASGSTPSVREDIPTFACAKRLFTTRLRAKR